MARLFHIPTKRFIDYDRKLGHRKQDFFFKLNDDDITMIGWTIKTLIDYSYANPAVKKMLGLLANKLTEDRCDMTLEQYEWLEELSVKHIDKRIGFSRRGKWQRIDKEDFMIVMFWEGWNLAKEREAMLPMTKQQRAEADELVRDHYDEEKKVEDLDLILVARNFSDDQLHYPELLDTEYEDVIQEIEPTTHSDDPPWD